MDKLLQELNEFLARATLAAYAAGGQEVDPENAEKGMKELPYGNPEDEWYYKDSYGGFFQSWGREVVWHNQKPYWGQVYGGGMQPEYYNDTAFIHRTFDFLKKALSAGDKKKSFQPRGPKSFREGDWNYACSIEGNIVKFKGSEKISHNEKVVFTHDFAGGLYIYKE